MKARVEWFEAVLAELGAVSLAKEWATVPTGLLLAYERRLRELLADVNRQLGRRRADLARKERPAGRTGLRNGRAGRVAALIAGAPEELWNERRVRERLPGIGGAQVTAVTLCDLAKRGYIRRVGRGLYRALDDRAWQGTDARSA
jgi:hypothetical protein